MQTELLRLRTANIGQTCAGFRLVKKEYVPSKHADLYTLRHEKTQAELLYFDRADENKTFAIAFKTLPGTTPAFSTFSSTACSTAPSAFLSGSPS